MQRLLAAILTTLSLTALAQPGEVLNDLITNHVLIQQNQPVQRTMDGQFVYFLDTLDLPLIDDFTENKFVPYDAVASDTNVSDTVFYKLYDLANTTIWPYDSFALDTTYINHYDTLSTGDTGLASVTPLPSMKLIEYDICNYPVVFDTVEVWPPYNIIDSSALFVADVPDTIYAPDMYQDSAQIFFVHAIASDAFYIWEDNSACKNDRYGIDPPTYGVCTFDGLNGNGYPHDFTHTGSGESADTLTSKAINMAQYIPNPDTVYLSFFYQSTGLGNEPEEEDSLLLEFWLPDVEQWVYAWSSPGKADNGFELVMVPLDLPDYYQDGFKFRFRNFASLSGSLDHWHIDYVYLNELRSHSDTLMNDLAFSETSDGLLSDHTAMPWKHYKWDPASPVVDTSFVTVMNTASGPSSIDQPTSAMEVSYEGTVDMTQGIFNPGNVPPLAPTSQFYDLPVGFEYDTTHTGTDTCAIFDVRHWVKTGTNNRLQENDTIRFKQVFSNYYAYDDGTAEAAYGVQGGGARVAYKFSVAQPDSLRSVMFHWSPSVTDVSQNLFRLTVWADDGSGKPGAVLYETNALFGESPIYSSEKNGFVEYFFKDNITGQDSVRVPVSGTYFVGWTQSDPDVLNVGFDRNIDKSDRIYYNIGSFWTNTSFAGALMIRPVFISDKDGLLSHKDLEEAEVTFEVYPNPATDYLFVQVEDAWNYNYELLDMSGQLLGSGPATNRIEVAGLSGGLYLVRLISQDGRTAVRKFLKP